ncbi:MAG: hypothetical protein SGI84_02920 [Gemmatimonadota bacterium]|nr:hypothetical protein [Gemmatimonadota bacterium]
MPPEPSRKLSAVIAGLAFGASATSLVNGFALDDIPIILKNARIHTLALPWTYFGQTYWPPDQGPALYRPLTILGFALEWLAGGGAPFFFHLVSLLLYVAGALAVFWLARQVLSLNLAFIASALFAVHPVHVEAVGNVVGQSELWVGLLLPLAVGWYLRARTGGPIGVRDGAIITLLYLAALCFKEHAVMLPALLVLAEFLLVRDPTPARARVARVLPLLLALGAVLVAFWFIRTNVTGGMVGRDILPAFRTGGTPTRLFTALGVVPQWVRLLLWPAHLSADYNPQELSILTAFGLRPFLGVMVILGFLGLAAGTARRHPVIAFGVLWVGVTLFPVSNLLLPTGILLAERTFLLPSVGMMLALAGAAAAWGPASTVGSTARLRPAAVLLGMVILAGLGWSAIRQRVWRDNPTLFAQTALDAPRSYKARAAHAVMLFEAGSDSAGEREYRTAISLYDQDPNIIADLGNWYLGKKRWQDALDMYTLVLAQVPDHWTATSRSILSLMNLDRLEEAQRLATVAAQRGDKGAAEKLAYVNKLLADRKEPKPGQR